MTKALLTHVYIGTLIQACHDESVDVIAAQEVAGFGSDIQKFNWPYVKNLPKQSMWLGKNDVPSDDWFMIAQPPCSGGSMVTPSHSRGGLDNPKSAFKVSKDYLEYAFGLNPPIIAVESVPGTLKLCGDDITMIRDMYGKNYGVSYILDNSNYHGCCSIRKRLWYVFWRRDKFPDGIRWERGQSNTRSIEEALRDIDQHDDLHKVSPSQQKIYDRFSKLFEAMPQGNYANNFLRKTGRWDLVPSDFPVKTKVNGEKFIFYESVASFKLSYDKPCPTITGSTFLIHPTEGRPLTSREYLRINGMPDTFNFPISVRHNQHVMYTGKTVAVGIARWVIRNIKMNLDMRETENVAVQLRDNQVVDFTKGDVTFERQSVKKCPIEVDQCECEVAEKKSDSLIEAEDVMYTIAKLESEEAWKMSNAISQEEKKLSKEESVQDDESNCCSSCTSCTCDSSKTDDVIDRINSRIDAYKALCTDDNSNANTWIAALEWVKSIMK